MKEYRRKNGDKYYKEHREEIGLVQKQKWSTDDEFRKNHSKQSMSWYHLHKTDPEFLKKRMAASKKNYKVKKSTPEYKFDYYRRCSSSRRKIPFELTYDQFLTFWKKPCVYCKDFIDTIGLDRIDNSKGYTFENVASCCRICNIMKQKMTVAEFILHVRKILSQSILSVVYILYNHRKILP